MRSTHSFLDFRTFSINLKAGFRLLHNFILSDCRFAKSPNPSDSEWFKIGVTVGSRFNGGSNES